MQAASRDETPRVGRCFAGVREPSAVRCEMIPCFLEKKCPILDGAHLLSDRVFLNDSGAHIVRKSRGNRTRHDESALVRIKEPPEFHV